MPLMERVPGAKGGLSRVTKSWVGETVLCVGGGPSTKQELVDLARGKCRVIVINNAYQLAPWADAHYFADFHWWQWHKDKPEYKAFQGQRISIQDSTQHFLAQEPEVFVLRNGGGQGLSDDPSAVNTGSNSGYQVLNIAFLSGAKKILLLGYDMRFTDGRCHWHPPHPNRTQEDAYRRYAKRFTQTAQQINAAGIDVVNCSPGSLINTFRRGDLIQELESCPIIAAGK